MLLDDVERRSQTVADGTDDFAVFNRTRRVDEDSAEHLHVEAAIEHLHQAVVRQPGVGLEEHQRHLTLGREHGRIALRMLLWKMRCQFFGHLLERKHGMDASEFADGEALTKFFRKSYSVNGNVGCMSPIFCNFTMKI